MRTPHPAASRLSTPLLLCAALATLPSCATQTVDTGEAQAAATDDEALRIVARQTLEFNAPARRIPSNLMVDGPLLGNGDLGATVAGPPESLRFHVGKNDFWGQKTQSPQPVSRIEIATAAVAGAPYKASCDLLRARWTGEFAKDASALRASAFVDANAGRLVVGLENTGTQPLEISVRIFKGTGKTEEPGDFLHAPDGTAEGMRQAAVSLRVVGPEKSAFTLAPGARADVVAAVLSDLDAKDPLAAAKALTASSAPKKIAAAAKAHEAWWDAFWRKSFVEIPDKKLERHWYASQYIMASCSRAGKVAPGLWGNWITMDKPGWHGDFHLNYNFQAPYYAVYAANHPEVSLPFYDALTQSIPRGRKIAEKRGEKGIFLPVAIGPWGMCPSGDDAHHGQKSNTAYAALNFVWYWQHTQDLAWLAKTGYPYLREVEKFWTADLKKMDGRYVVEHDAIHEQSGGAGRSGVSSDFNPILTLGLLRTLYAGMLETSAVLGVDAELHPKWRDILAHLSAFPTQEKNGKTVFRYTEQGTAWWDGNTLGIQHIYPAGAIGLDSGPKLLEISRDMIDAMGRWNDYNGSSSWYTACARVGYDPDKTLAEMRRMYDRHAMPNGILYFGGGGIENASPTLAITEMLMQSHEGVVRFFPSWPAKQDARFGGLRARGAFLVSAQLKDGAVSGVAITSEKGVPLTVQNPWPKARVQVTRDGKPAETVEGTRFTLKTKAGEVLMLAPGNAGLQAR